MKKILFLICLLSTTMLHADICTINFSETISEDGSGLPGVPFVIDLTSSVAGTVNGISVSSSSFDNFCNSWYNFEIVVDGTGGSTTANVCDFAGITIPTDATTITITPIDCCGDNLADNNIDVSVDIDFDIVGACVPGCTNVAACNYDSAATIADGTCELPGDACDDADPATINDVLQADCACAGVLAGCTDATACNFNPAAGADDGSCVLPGDACDDANPATINDVLQADCTCAGTVPGTCASGATQIQYDDFEAAALAWVFTPIRGTENWEIGDINTYNSYFSPIAGNGLFFDDDNAGSGVDNAVSAESPAVDLTTYTSVNLSFDLAIDGSDEGFVDVEVYDGTSWVNIGNFVSTGVDEWLPISIDVSTYANSAFQVRYTYDDGGTGWEYLVAVDNFLLCGVEEVVVTPCPDSTPATCTVCTTCETTVDLDITSGTTNVLGATFDPGFVNYNPDGIPDPVFDDVANTGTFTIPAGPALAFTQVFIQDLTFPDNVTNICFSADVDVQSIDDGTLGIEFIITNLSNPAAIAYNTTLTGLGQSVIGGDLASGVVSPGFVFNSADNYEIKFALTDYDGGVNGDIAVNMCGLSLSFCTATAPTTPAAPTVTDAACDTDGVTLIAGTIDYTPTTCAGANDVLEYSLDAGTTWLIVAPTYADVEAGGGTTVDVRCTCGVSSVAAQVSIAPGVCPPPVTGNFDTDASDPCGCGSSFTNANGTFTNTMTNAGDDPLDATLPVDWFLEVVTYSTTPATPGLTLAATTETGILDNTGASTPVIFTDNGDGTYSAVFWHAPGVGFELLGVTGTDGAGTTATFPDQSSAGCTSCEVATSDIPTLSEWGLITLALMLMSYGSIAMAGAGRLAGSHNAQLPMGFQLPFNAAILRKAFVFTGILALIGYTMSIVLFGAIFFSDIIGVAIAGPVFAYLAHLLYIIETNNNK